MANVQKFTTAFALISNIAISVVIVLLNKWIYQSYGFPNMSLTCIHFIVTACGMEAAKMLGVFLVKSLPMKDMILLSMSFCGFVVLTNLSLQSNTVGTYQISKFMTTPCIIFIQSLCFGKTFHWSIKITLVPVCLGVFLNNYNDVSLNTAGLLYASGGVVVTSIYQVWVGSKQHEFQANSMQLLYYQAPLSAALLMVVIVFVEPPFAKGGVFSQLWSLPAVVSVLCSGAVAFLVNLSIFWVIGNTSPLTYNMAGHLKFCLIASGGFFIFHELPSFHQSLGIILTISGVLSYTYLKLAEQKDASATAASSKPQQRV